jgi:tyrosyl-tRNA synthetase
MSIPDGMMYKYYTLLTDDNLQEIKALHPRQAKSRLAKAIITQYYSAELARKADEEFDRVFASKELPQDMPHARGAFPLALVDIMVEAGLCKSKNEARRLIRQNAVEFEGARIIDESHSLTGPGILKVGSRRFLKITA